MKTTYCTLLLVASAIFQATAIPLPGPNPDQAATDLAKRIHVLTKRDGSSLAYVSGTETFLIYNPTVEVCLYLGDGSTDISNNTDSDVELFEDENCDPQSWINKISPGSTVSLGTLALTAKILQKY
ncbi:hypothetical protein MVEG_10052 [Podila verticillata NRRL 6337]|nr:MAG: hypothetical protein BYD32DRAFT_427575 [Podila humilis]KFH64227.1 hypothetical protein MVEG_10052 [Podila verticillata NRRL 6337]